VAVIDPLVKIPRRQAAHVGRQIGSGPAQLAEAQEFIGPEMIRVILPRAVRRSFRPSRVYPEVRAARAILARPDAVAPVVAVGETPARPPDDARLDSLHRFDDRLPDAADVGDLRVLAHPDAVIDHAAQMLDEMSVYFRRDFTDQLVQYILYSRVGHPRLLRGEAPPGQRQNASGQPGLDELTSSHAMSFCCQSFLSQRVKVSKKTEQIDPRPFDPLTL